MTRRAETDRAERRYVPNDGYRREQDKSRTATELRGSARRNRATPAATTAIYHAKPPISSKARMRELPVIPRPALRRSPARQQEAH